MLTRMSFECLCLCLCLVFVVSVDDCELNVQIGSNNDPFYICSDGFQPNDAKPLASILSRSISVSSVHIHSQVSSLRSDVS